MSNTNNNSNSGTTTTPTFEPEKIIDAAAERAETAEEEAAELVWTTWEELLLASAVKRHGVRDWDAVAMEVQNRSAANSSSFSLLTPRICQEKFSHLQRRFVSISAAGGGDDVSTDGDDVSVPLLEELRKLRMAELRLEVQRYDLSIQSLQIQVKRLEGERERSSKGTEPEKDGVDRSDLEKDNIANIDNKNSDNLNSIKEEAERSENDKKVAGNGLPEKEPSGEDENRSVNESNSSGNRGTGSGLKSHPEPVEIKPEPKPVGEDSCNDSSDRHNEEMKIGDSGELRGGGESAELRGGDSVDCGGTATTIESSDVQSTASLTIKRRRLRKTDGDIDGGGGCGGGSGLKGGDKAVVIQSGGIKRRESLVKSEPLIEFLDVIRSFKDSSIFERRLDSQKTDKYKNMIRQHVDLGLIQARIDDGSYSSCPKKFYLDLLLLFNNAIVFFPKSSPELRAANSLRIHVMEELKKIRNTFEPIHESTSMKLQPKPELERSDSLLVKHRSTSPIVVVCRKRSSIGVKPSSSGSKSEKPADNKSLLTLKPPVKTSSSTLNEDDSLIKLKLKEKPVTGARSARRGSKSRPNSNPTQSNPNSNQNTSSSSQQAGSAQKGEDSKLPEKKKTELSSAAKKRGAADFLKRIKKNSPAKGSLAEALKGSEDDSNGSKTDHLKKKVEVKKVIGPLRRSGNGTGGGRQLKGDDSPSKKNVGRPPKKSKDLPPPKRGRDGEGEGSSKRPVKRPRR